MVAFAQRLPPGRHGTRGLRVTRIRRRAISGRLIDRPASPRSWQTAARPQRSGDDDPARPTHPTRGATGSSRTGCPSHHPQFAPDRHPAPRGRPAVGGDPGPRPGRERPLPPRTLAVDPGGGPGSADHHRSAAVLAGAPRGLGDQPGRAADAARAERDRARLAIDRRGAGILRRALPGGPRPPRVRGPRGRDAPRDGPARVCVAGGFGGGQGVRPRVPGRHARRRRGGQRAGARVRGADQHPAGRRRRDARALRDADRHDDGHLARPGRQDGVDGVDPARHGVRPARQRRRLRPEDQLAAGLRGAQPG